MTDSYLSSGLVGYDGTEYYRLRKKKRPNGIEKVRNKRALDFPLVTIKCMTHGFRIENNKAVQTPFFFLGHSMAFTLVE